MGGVGAAANQENRVVPGHGAGDFRELGAIDPLGKPLRLSTVGPDDKQRVDALEPADERGHGAAQVLADCRADTLGSRPRVRAVSGALHQP
jgi:hypothetical protein